MPLILPYLGLVPKIDPTAFVAPNATVIGNVVIGPEASVWFGAVLRGDETEHRIHVEAGANVQDNCVIHVSAAGPTVIGPDVTVGHGAMMESCAIGARALIGMNAVILPGSEIGEEALIGAGAVVAEGTEVPPRHLAAGVPARVRKELSGSSAAWIARSAEHYVAKSRRYLASGIGNVER